MTYLCAVSRPVALIRRFAPPRAVVQVVLAAAALVVVPDLDAQNPWEDSINNIRDLFTGTIASAVSAIAVVVGGLMFAFGEPGAKKLVAGIVMGVGMAMGAVNLVTWLGG